MADVILETTEGLIAAVRTQVNPMMMPAVVTFNSHITGLAVARSLGRRGVPMIALDPDPHAFAFASKYATVAAICPYVLADEAAFIAYLCELGDVLARPAVLFPTNDEWVLAINRHRARLEGRFLIPFSGPEVVEPVLDKARLYRTARKLAIPIPGTWDLTPETYDAVAPVLPYPCIVKPTEQRAFYDAFGDKAWRINEPGELRTAMDRAAGHPLVAQEIIGQGLSDFYSVCSYIGSDGEAHGTFVGRKLEQYPPDFGTGCLVSAEGPEEIAARGVRMLQAFGYRGVSEIEFIYDARDGEQKLLDINTRVWKWIGLPIAAGVDLPWLAYSDAIGQPDRATHTHKSHEALTWTYAKDYLALRLGGRGNDTAAYLPETLWAELVSGHASHIVDAVIDADDPGPAGRMLAQLVNPRPYYCAC